MRVVLGFYLLPNQLTLRLNTVIFLICGENRIRAIPRFIDTLEPFNVSTYIAYIFPIKILHCHQNSIIASLKNTAAYKLVCKLVFFFVVSYVSFGAINFSSEVHTPPILKFGDKILIPCQSIYF